MGKPIKGKPIMGKPIKGKPIRGRPIMGKPIKGKPIRGKPIKGKADLSKTYLSSITLKEFVKKHNVEVKNNLLIMYKKVNKDLTSSFDKKVKYVIGKETKLTLCNGDIMQNCGNGLHVSSLDFARNFPVTNGVIIQVKVSPFDIVAIPVNGEGKIRVNRLKTLKVVKE